MGAVRFVTRATARYRWQSWLALCLLVSLASGLVSAAVEAGDRTASAFPRFAAAHGFDAALFSFGPLPRLAKLPEVASVTEVATLANGAPACDCSRSLTSADFTVYAVPQGELASFVQLVAGRMPNPADPEEVLASYTL